jgi:hypothetical protein
MTRSFDRVVLVVAALLMLRPAVGAPQAATTTAGSLRFFKNYFVTGDYVSAGIGLRGTGVNGLARADIDMTAAAIPDGVDVLAAFLYWETVDLQKNIGVPTGASFRGNDISHLAMALNPAGTAPCWSSGGGTGGSDGAHKMVVYRADVLRFIPLGPDGKHLVKTAHHVELPDAGSGNVVPSTAGATLVVVYRDATQPLRAIVLYDGGFTLDQSTSAMVQPLAGFYQAASNSAKMTHIVGDGQANFSERLLFNGAVVANNPFTGALGPASDPAWDSPTFTVTDTTQSALADPASTVVDRVGVTPYDCLSWGAVVFSTTVRDTDGDGLLDIWESSPTALLDPNGRPLPNLRAMGADPNMKDIFIEVGYLKSSVTTSNPLQPSVPPHSHLPSKKAIDMLGDAFARAPVTNPNGRSGIRMHVDVGASYQTQPADPYVIPAAQARGGEAIDERTCLPGSNCQFQDFAGTIGWKSGYRFYRDQPLNYATESDCVAAGAACIRRFDRNRKDMFHYALFAHAIGLPRSDDPASPLFHVPKNTSGIADLVGGDIMVTLGFWDNYTGSDYMQAATLMHELGHNLALRHGGLPLEFNCKPNYQSVMNYLFQARGLITPTGASVLDYSRQALPALNPNSVSETAPFQPATTLPYYTRWYSPLASSLIDRTVGTTPATKHCSGSPITETVGWVRVDGTTVTAPIDWNANGATDLGTFSQDLSFNGIRTANGQIAMLNAGVNDWGLVDLRQVGGRRNVGSRRINGGLSLDVGFGDVGFGDVGFGDVGFGDVGFGDVGFGDVGYGDVGFGDVGFGDVGFGDVGFGDVGFGDVGAPRGDMDLDTATSLGNAPDTLAATLGKASVTLTWQPPHVGAVNYYNVYRVTGTSVTPATIGTLVTVASPTAPTTTAVDTTVKNNNTYTYFVAARFFDGTQSGISNLVTVLVK